MALGEILTAALLPIVAFGVVWRRRRLRRRARVMVVHLEGLRDRAAPGAANGRSPPPQT
jgi:hypothetical protein